MQLRPSSVFMGPATCLIPSLGCFSALKLSMLKMKLLVLHRSVLPTSILPKSVKGNFTHSIAHLKASNIVFLFFTSNVLTRSIQPPKYFLNPYTLLQLNHLRHLVWPHLLLGQLTHVFVSTTCLISFHSPNNILVEPAAAAAAKLLQSCPTLCDPIDGSPPGSPIPGILKARTLEWVVISFSNG